MIAAASCLPTAVPEAAFRKPEGVLAIVCPGQGAQTPGLLSPWLELPGLSDHLARLAEACGVDLLRHGTVSDAETIRDTAVAQPLIVACGLLALGELFPDRTAGALVDPDRVVALGGHSVGEITATAAAGVLDETTAMRFVGVRGREMAAAATVTATGMSAVLGGDAAEVTAVLEREGLTPANVNGAGQVVAAGTLDQLAALTASPPARARVIPLQVAGAFHTVHMAPAVAALAREAALAAPRDPEVRLLSNADGTAVDDGTEVMRRLVAQVSNPVRWDLCIETLAALGTTAILELPPAGTLANLAKRAMRGVQVVALRTPDDLEAARALVTEHANGPTTAADGEAGTPLVDRTGRQGGQA